MDRLSFEKVLADFDLAAYGDVRSFGVCEWSFVLSRRRHLIDMAQWHDRAELWESMLLVLSSPTLREPLKPEPVYMAAVEDLTNYAAWCMRKVIEDSPKIASQCMAEDDGPTPVASTHEVGSDGWWKDLMAHDQANSASGPDLFASYNDLLVEGPFESESAYVEVLLSAPDEVILRDFAIWLAGMRRRKEFDHSPVKRFTDKELARWAQNRVLPYLDLKIAADISGEKIPHHVIGGILFDGQDVDVAEKVRKTVAPLADELISYEMLESLKQAANAVRRRSGTN